MAAPSDKKGKGRKPGTRMPAPPKRSGGLDVGKFAGEVSQNVGAANRAVHAAVRTLTRGKKKMPTSPKSKPSAYPRPPSQRAQGTFRPRAKMDTSQVRDRRGQEVVRRHQTDARLGKRRGPKGGTDIGKFAGEVGRNVSGAAGNFGKGVNEVNRAIGAAGEAAFGGLRSASRRIPDGAQSKRNNEALKKALGRK